MTAVASPLKYLILAKIESSQFTDPTPTQTANAILVSNMKVTPLKVTNESRGLARPYFGNSEQIPVMEEAMTTFDVEIAGSGSPLGTAAAYGPLLRACGFAETLNASTSAVYAPVSSGFETVTLYTHRDGILYKMTGCAGNVVLNFAAKKIPKFSFTFTGKYVPVTDVSLPTSPVYTGFIKPGASIPSMMGTVTIGGYSAKISDFSVDMANDVSHAIWMNQETLAIVNRLPKGSLTAEMVTVATKDYWTSVRNATTVAVTVTQGTTTGNIVTVAAPAMQLTDINEAVFEKMNALKMTTAFMPHATAGNDELTITLT